MIPIASKQASKQASSEIKPPLTQNSRIFAFDYLKALCILFVIITHLAVTDVLRKDFLYPFWIDMAVPIFMIISGYVYSLSCEKRHISSINNWFTYKNFKPKFMRILNPFFITYFIEVVIFYVYYTHTNTEFTPIQYLIIFITGGWGPGSYYVPVLIQLLLLFPLLYFLFKKSPLYGALTIICAQIVLEIIIHGLSISVDIYRLLFFRYMIFILFGMILYYYKDRIRPIHLCLSFVVGGGFILATNYLGYTPILFTYWTTTSLPTAFYTFVMVFLFLRIFECDAVKKIHIPEEISNTFCLLGRASFHIYLTQMVYYATIYTVVRNLLPLPLELIISIIVCCAAGVVFYCFEERCLKKIPFFA
jgi:surface polysaccharide O-acyltransferase-like enzyme